MMEETRQSLSYFHCMLLGQTRYPGQNSSRSSGENPSRSSDRQLTLALDLLKKLKEGGAAFFTANPPAAQHVDTILNWSDRVYLAHEYLDEHWDTFPFSEVAARFAEAKLSFVCSATLPENLNTYSCQPKLLPLLAQTDDPAMHETLRDYAVNKRFRRDVFARGTLRRRRRSFIAYGPNCVLCSASRTQCGTKCCTAEPGPSLTGTVHRRKK